MPVFMFIGPLLSMHTWSEAASDCPPLSNVDMYVYTYVHICMCIRIHTYMYVYVYTYILCTYVYAVDLSITCRGVF